MGLGEGEKRCGGSGEGTEGRKGGRSEGFIKGKKSAGVEAPFIDPVKDSNARALTQPLS